MAEVVFVRGERRGTAGFHRIDETCVRCFPTAADVVMGNPAPPPRHATKEAAVAHEEIVDRHSRLARTAMAGEAADRGCLGAAGYDDTATLPEGAVQASLGCGNPVAVADLREG
ncbi:hypothetical protein [Streptosporangium vulgare]|uniref:Uncharacterized protein n=1 Tax=Streptosporangium vulgare TaxID=46190 RepID=A0ABV5TD45_9ACTN